MRLPAVRYECDDFPLAWWEVPFLPLVAIGVCLMLLGAMLVSVPVLVLYPDLRHVSTSRNERTEREQEVVWRYLRFTSRVTF